MRMHRVLPLSFVLALLPVATSAQSTDAEYCAKLADLALRYLGKQILGESKPDVPTVVAIDRCQKGDTAAGIPILEAKLRNGGFTLPAR
jgi:hypothetical protein